MIFQDLPLIDRTIANNELAANPALQDLITKLKKSGGTCHLMGLTSPGGVHAHQDHMIALTKIVTGAGHTGLPSTLSLMEEMYHHKVQTSRLKNSLMIYMA